MSSSSGFLPPLLVGMVSGAAGAMLVIFLNAGPNTDQESTESPADRAVLTSRIADLEQLVQQQAVAIDTLRLRQPATGLQRQSLDGPSREEFDEMQARLDALMIASPDMPESLASNRLDTAIEGVLNQREEAERLERERIAEEKRQVRLSNHVNYWSEELGLSDVQATQMRELLDTREQSRQEIMAAIRSGEMSKADAGQPWQQIDTDYRQGLGGMLTPQQLTDMEASGRMSK